MVKENYNKFKSVLEEIFQLNNSELDFGIYRILNYKREEILKFLNEDLLPQVENELNQYSRLQSNILKDDIKKLEKRLLEDEVDVDSNPKYIRLKNKLKEVSDTNDIEEEVYSYLVNFFKRYYKDGDFISLRRYKKDTYAIPYEGEEVKLYWANNDQYYIKTSENFRDYIIKLENGKRVNLKLVEGQIQTVTNNKKEKERKFIIHSDNPITIEDEELVIRLEYRADSRKQDTINKEIVQLVITSIKEQKEMEKFILLCDVMPTEKNQHRTLLEKHLDNFTARNKFDYFIHKNLGEFLNRELDYYIKNEVISLDDIDELNKANFELHLIKAKIIKIIGYKFISMLNQVENFQKLLWLKKKFIYDVNYCITIDRIPQEFYEEVISNKKQVEEWKESLGVDSITKEVLIENQTLVLDTINFSQCFKEKLVETLDNYDSDINGILINSENFQALNLIQEKFNQKVKCIYIDPPYNTGSDDFVYKDNFQESSWLTCMDNRINLSKTLFKEGGTIAVSIDLKELDKTIMLLDNNIGPNNRRANITIRRSSVSGAKVINPGPVNISENVIIYSNGNGNWEPKQSYRERDYDSRYSTMIINPEEEYSEWKFETVLDSFSKFKGIPKSQLKKQLGESYREELYSFIIDNSGRIIRFASLDDNSISKEATEAKKLSKENPETIIHLQRAEGNDYYLKNGDAILFYKDRLKWMGESLVPVELISDIWDDVLPNDLHNEGGVNLRKGKKPEKLINRIFESTTTSNDIVLDFFAGSGTSGAVALKAGRKFINIEINDYFKNLTVKRIKNTLTGEQSGVSKLYQWKGGGIVKYFSLESYEDALNNININTNEEQLNLLDSNKTIKEKYMLNYLLIEETKGSASLLDTNKFINPFEYKLKISKSSELENTNVDLVETFNYLLGIEVLKNSAREFFDLSENGELIKCDYKKYKFSFKSIIGRTNQSERILIIWRNVTKDLVESNKALEYYFSNKKSSIDNFEFDKIYINGDNNIPSLTIDNEGYKIILIEEEFKKKMFDFKVG